MDVAQPRRNMVVFVEHAKKKARHFEFSPVKSEKTSLRTDRGTAGRNGSDGLRPVKALGDVDRYRKECANETSRGELRREDIGGE